MGGAGIIEADGIVYELNKLDTVYLGKGTVDIKFSSASSDTPADFFLMSTPAHHAYPNTLMKKENASPVHLGNTATANKRTIYKYIHEQGIQSCQLVMANYEAVISAVITNPDDPQKLLNYATAAVFGKLQEQGDATGQEVLQVESGFEK